MKRSVRFIVACAGGQEEEGRKVPRFVRIPRVSYKATSPVTRAEEDCSSVDLSCAECADKKENESDCVPIRRVASSSLHQRRREGDQPSLSRRAYSASTRSPRRREELRYPLSQAAGDIAV